MAGVFEVPVCDDDDSFVFSYGCKNAIIACCS